MQIKGKYIAPGDFWNDAEVGDFSFTDNNQRILIKYGEEWRFAVSLPISSEQPDNIFWEWDGNTTAPTLSPSIRTEHHDVIFHGYMKSGILEYCNDSTIRPPESEN